MAHTNIDIPYLELAEPEEGYHGLIRENETLVEVTPAIRARGPLCSFLILNNKHHGEAPFEVRHYNTAFKKSVITFSR
ncbi:unnamed protein product [Euphydryas editha]|uniref:Uncharacterized protein n=1 Tax=Euphydryas editha TaxID=104508 RepID=A0AAU9UN87_EUPED|nr:unnamed protein product [Euphydryas editha]